MDTGTRYEGELRESEERFRTVFEASPDAIFIRQLAGPLLEVNRVAVERYGYSREELLTMGPEDLVPAHLLDHLASRTQESLRTGLPVDWVHRRKDGMEIPVELLLRPFTLHGTPCIYACARDIADRKRAEAERAAYQAQLAQSQKMESLGSMAGGVAHDINNALGAILAVANANQFKAEPDSPLARDLEIIAKACLRGGNLVKGLLGFARQRLAEERELNLNALVQETATLLARTTFQKVRVRTDLAEPLPSIRGDGAALNHALMNLCVNAVDAMPEGGTLTVRTRHEGGWVMLEVADTGSGMAPDILDKALDPFFTTKATGKGTGLGLALVYATVKAHHGHLELLSDPGLGTRALVRIPASLPPAREAPAPRPLHAPASLNLRVLLVDDDDLVRMAVKVLLETLGHGVTATSGGEEAVTLLQGGLETDVIILDMNMPGMDGAATLPLIRILAPRIPVLLATGRIDESAVKLVNTYPGVKLLPKPFSREELQHLLPARA